MFHTKQLINKLLYLLFINMVGNFFDDLDIIRIYVRYGTWEHETSST